MKAQDIVSAILEAEADRASGALFYFDGMDESGFFVAAPDDGDIFAKIVDVIGELYPAIAPQSELRKDTDVVVAAMMDQFGLVVVLSFEGEVAVYSRLPSPRLPVEFIRKLELYFNVTPQTETAWFDAPDSDQPHIAHANSTIYGKKGLVTPPNPPPERPLRTFPKPADLATEPWDIEHTDPRGPVEPLSGPQMNKFRQKFWRKGYHPMTGDAEKFV